MRSDFVDIEGLEVRRKDRRAKGGVQCTRVVHFRCEFSHSRHVTSNLVPYTVQRLVARDIDIE